MEKLFYNRLNTLERENQLLHHILDNLSDGIYATDKNGKIIIYNKTMESIESTNREYVLGYKDTEIYNVFSTENYLRKELIESGSPIKNRHLGYYMANGYKVEMVCSAYPYYHDNELSGFYCIMQDTRGITQLQERIITLQGLIKEGKSANHFLPNGTIYTFPDIIGESPTMKETIQKARHIAASPTNVLIYGETGTGKELFAHSIHNASQYHDGPFIPVNCASIPDTLLESQMFGTVKGAFSDARDLPGFFEQAENGTLFLDEINSMNISLQAKLLRVLQDKVVCRLGSNKPKIINCRIICATNKDPLKPAFIENFREDLLYRLMTVMIMIPPLRERKEDIPLLCNHFVTHLNEVYNTRIIQIDNEFHKVLQTHDWPGNVRQLGNLLEGCICYLPPNTNILKTEHIPSHLRSQFDVDTYTYSIERKESLNNQLDNFETHILTEALCASNGNMAKAARILGISRQNMKYRLKRLNITPKPK